jgi:carboxymethylenebutenolidase
MYRSQIAESISYRGHNGDEIEAYFAYPLGDGKFPSVVLLHHAPAWDEASIEMVRKFAHYGYATISPHLFSRESQGTASPEDAAAVGRASGGVPDDRMLGDVEGAIKFLRDRPSSNGKVGTIGFCVGGRQSFLVGCSLAVDAVVDCWGADVVLGPDQLTPRHPVAVIDMVPNLTCPLLGIFGADDYNPSLLQVKMIEEVLKQHHKEHEFHIYEGAGHSFFTTDELNYRVEQALDGWRIRLL